MECIKTLELNLSLLLEENRICTLKISGMEDLHRFLSERCNLTPDKYFLKNRGRPVYSYENLEGIIHVVPRLCGGKGGFGSMLRAIGAQIEKTTNREACRDLSGRRLRDINEEQRLKKWISQQSEREKEIEERKKKKLAKLSAEPKFEFNDKTYEHERSDLVEKISDSVEQGLIAATSKKRPVENDDIPLKKRKTILDFDEDLSSTDSESSDDDSKEENKEICQVTKEQTNELCRNVEEETKKICTGIDEKNKEICEGAKEVTTETHKAEVNIS
ncbi:splicing regulator SDE2 [Halyomorpha halys]|uniref:splicing regulator SDE2 n=1 Tax=Halyomorpha halys TaxID=286706 RepID=UPI0006D4E94A|nr:replication stress response regulator SDE2 [Halyomorpha halys]